MEPFLAAFQQWVLFAGFAATAGCIAWRAIVAPGAARLLPRERRIGLAGIEGKVARAGVATGLVLIGVWILRMVVQVMGFRDEFVPLWEDVSFLLFETFWGTVWMAQGVIIPVLTLAFWQAGVRASALGGREKTSAEAGTSRMSWPWLSAAILTLALAATLALSSHAMSAESWKPMIVAADAVHAIAAGSWIGTLGLILTVGRPTEGVEMSLDLFAAQIRSFSPMAIASVTVLLSMGIVLAWTHLSVLSDLWTMTYGRILSAKIGLAGTVFGAGFVNWRKGIPVLGTEAGARATWRRAAWEVSMAAGVLLLTAALVHSPKP